MNSILQIFYKSMVKKPKKIAVKYRDTKLTYEDLFNNVVIISENLRKINIKKGDIVGVSVRKDQYYIPIILAIWNIGCAFVPIDIEVPDGRKEYMINDSNLKSIIVEASNNINENDKAKVILKDEILKQFDTVSYKISKDAIKDNDIAYIIYTSGTTGSPKGVIITNDNLYNLIYGLIKEIGVDSNLNILSLANIGFDISISELLLPISVGGQLCIALKRCLTDMELLKRLLITENINFMQATPITWKMLIKSKWKNESKMRIACGAEKLDAELCENLLDVSQGYIYNMYGPTEATVWSSIGKIYNKEDINIGKPIINMEYYVLNNNLEEVKENEKGELFIAGKGLSSGYLHNNELTKKKFLKNRYSKEYKFMYATGDLVYKKENNYYYINRKDFQVKLNGHRVELEEIENRIKRIINMDTIIVLKENKLVAYVEGTQSIKEDFIINELEKYLPQYMIPYKYIFISKFPLTHNKKIDRKKLEGA